MRMIVKAEQKKRWLEENQAALAAYNARVSRHGLLSDDAGVLWTQAPDNSAHHA
jgi:post-segregation antitoxin (ccd killing protein)